MVERKREPIPDIPTEYLKKAAEIIDKEGVPKGRESDKYVVIINGKQYPPKHLIATGYRAWKGEEWPVSKFSGGDQTNPYLIRRGFEVRRLSGELVSINEYRKTGFDFSPLLKEYLEIKYGLKISKGTGRSHLTLPSGTVLHVRGSKKLKRGAFYYLQEEDYHDIQKNPNWYFVAVYDKPETSLVLPGETLKEIFEGKPLTYQKNKKPKWYFDIREKDGRYSLVLHHGGAKEHGITSYLNRWKQISDFAGLPITRGLDQTSNTTQYFLVQVSEIGSKNLLQVEPVYKHYGWQETPRDSDHGKVKPGDILLVYFARKAIDFNMQLKKVYRVDAVTKNNEEFGLTEVQELKDLSLESVRKAIENGKLSNKFEKLGQQGFNIIQIDKSDLDSVLALDSGASINMQNNPVKGLTLGLLAESILFQEKDLKELEDLLIEKQQLIFYGPPGTSKTYVARKFASYFVGSETNVKIVQFHPSYSYEDFIEGIRPKTSENGDNVGFSKQLGLFSTLVTDCKSRPNEKFVLIIDEINRGNIAKIFGELIYLLEYRDEKVFLTYSPDKEFWIPKNLYIIGTMNSADRSIAYIDYALRRRFYFKGFYPDYIMLEKWFEKNPTRLNTKEYPRKIIETLTKVNEEIQEKFGPEYQVGHSYFMVKNLDEQRLKRILEYSIKPLLEQYFYGKKDDIEDLVEACNAMLPTLA